MTPIRTATLAEVYARQGHLDEACAIYRELVRRHPDEPGYPTRLAELEAALADAQGDTDHATAPDLGAGEATAGVGRSRRLSALKVLLERVRSRRRDRPATAGGGRDGRGRDEGGRDGLD